VQSSQFRPAERADLSGSTVTVARSLAAAEQVCWPNRPPTRAALKPSQFGLPDKARAKQARKETGNYLMPDKGHAISAIRLAKKNLKAGTLRAYGGAVGACDAGSTPLERTTVELAERLAIARSVEPLVAAARDRMDRECRLIPEAVDALRESGITRAAVPFEFDGPQLDPVAQIELIEEFSRVDGALGWCAMIACAASFSCGFLEADSARRWFGPPDACLAGQLHPTGHAETVEGGYVGHGAVPFRQRRLARHDGPGRLPGERAWCAQPR
jgi:hypothetical protein